MADYMRRVSYVVKIRDRPGEQGWGKLYEPVDDGGEEKDSELLEALVEANSYMDVGTLERWNVERKVTSAVKVHGASLRTLSYKPVGTVH